MDHPDYRRFAGEAADNTYIPTPFLAENANGQAKAFLEKYTEKYGRNPDYMSVHAYDAAGIILDCIEKEGANRAAVRDCLADIDSPEEAYHGTSGDIYFNEHGDCQKPPHVKVIRDGKQYIAEPY